MAVLEHKKKTRVNRVAVVAELNAKVWLWSVAHNPKALIKLVCTLKSKYIWHMYVLSTFNIAHYRHFSIFFKRASCVCSSH